MYRHDQPLKGADFLLCAAVLVLGLLITAAVCLMAQTANRKALQAAFELAVDERVSRLQRRFTVQDLKLDNVRRFFINADEVTRKEFLGFVEPLADEGESYGWVRRVRHHELKAFERQALRLGVENLVYHDSDPLNGARVPMQQRPEHFIVTYLLNRDGLNVAPGLDIASRPGRSMLLESARMNRELGVSDPLVLSNGQVGVVFYTPVFTDGLPAYPGDDGLRGFATAAVGVTYLMEHGIPAQSLRNLSISLAHANATLPSDELYHSVAVAAASDLNAQRTLLVANQRYQLNLRPTEHFLQANGNVLSLYVISASGGLLSLLLTWIVYLLISQRSRAFRLVESRTAELRTLSTTDHLTGVYNRRYFEQSVVRLLEHSQDGTPPLSLIMFDVDHFKKVNDAWGHEGGDTVLKNLCARVLGATRSGDMLCRTGGEEFTLVCPGTALEAAAFLAEKLRTLMAATPFPQVGPITCSFGVAQWAAPESLDQLTRRVDAAMYQAKAGGRDQVVTDGLSAA
ncbi:diguanylate cyclase [Pseudomonas sp. nanlin1]|uniref:sensor domain-containing diguanylate cyclase n=1 Tax=Pseudomonas sp. nanlin1 TaxID=3040605 RepID=UPI00388F24DE